MLCIGIEVYSVNVQSCITDKLKHSSVASTLKCLFLDFSEKFYNHRQLYVSVPNAVSIFEWIEYSTVAANSPFLWRGSSWET